MEYNGYVSLETIGDKLLIHPLMRGISYEAIIGYAIDFMRIVQCVGFFEERCTVVKVENYKGILPEDYFEMNQVRLVSNTIAPNIVEEDYGYNEAGELVPMGTYHNVLDDYGNEIYAIPTNINGTVFRYASDTFHLSNNNTNKDLVYKIQGRYIHTSLKEGMIEVSYQAILLDSKGYPLIPDNSKFTRALQAYIKKEWFTILFDTGAIQFAVLQNIQQEYAWAVGACESEFQKLSLDKAESFYNTWRTLLPRTREHSKGFATTNRRENLKIN